MEFHLWGNGKDNFLGDLNQEEIGENDNTVKVLRNQNNVYGLLKWQSVDF